MAIPASAIIWEDGPMDTRDRLDFVAQFGGLLEANEIIETAEINPLAEAVAVGLVLLRDAQHGPWIANDNNIEFWVEIAEDKQQDNIFNSSVSLPIEITINTNAVPPRRFQRTFVIKAGQR